MLSDKSAVESSLLPPDFWWFVRNQWCSLTCDSITLISACLLQLSPFFSLFFYFYFLTFIYFWDRERQGMNGGGAEREGDTELEAGSRLRAVGTEPDTGLEFSNGEIMT